MLQIVHLGRQNLAAVYASKTRGDRLRGQARGFARLHNNLPECLHFLAVLSFPRRRRGANQVTIHEGMSE
jgi:hypothetical protein